MQRILSIASKFTTANTFSTPVVTKRGTLPGGAMNASEALGAQRPVRLRIQRDRDGSSGALNGTLSVWGANIGNVDMIPAPVSPWGATVGGPVRNQKFKGDGTTTAFQTNFPYVAGGAVGTATNLSHVAIQRANALVAGAGTVTTVAGSSRVTGSSSAFLGLSAGQTIQVNGEDQVIANITSATVLDTFNAWAAANAGATYNVSPAFVTPAAGVTFSSGTNGNTLATFGTAPLNGSVIEIHQILPIEIMADAAHPFEEVTASSKDLLWVVANGATISASDASISAIT